MQTKTYHSKLLDNAVLEFSKLPGIGQSTALRLVLHLLRIKNEEVTQFTNAITQLKNEIKYCNICNNISDTGTCLICSNKARHSGVVCVVENIRDVLAIENTMQFNGLYHVLGGIISPMDGTGPGDLSIDLLEKRAAKGEIKEIIFALSTTMEGDTTCFYIFKKLNKFNITFSTIARGVSLGDELHYTDEATLGNSILKRIKYDGVI